MYIDTHCHLTFPQYDPDRAMAIGNAKKANVKQFICPGVDLFSSQQTIILSQRHSGVIFAAVGFHPYEAQHDFFAGDLEKLINQNVIAIGECGLDYHQYKEENAESKKTNQKRMFEEQMQLALKHNLPVIFHCRDAYEDFFDVIDSLPSLPRGTIHCFSGGLQELRFAQERKFFVGVDGNVTYSTHLAAIVPHIPLSMLLLETDAPFLTPEPHRGERNEPKYIPLVAKKIAQLQKKPLHEIEEQTTYNAQALFNLLS